MNNSQLLIVVEKPQQYDDHRQPNDAWLHWQMFLGVREKLGMTISQAETLPENFVMIPLPGSLIAATELLSSACVRSLPHTVWYLEVPPVICE